MNARTVMLLGCWFLLPGMAPSVDAALISVTSGPSCSITDTVLNATACSGAWSGNNKGNANRSNDVLAELLRLSGFTGWYYADDPLDDAPGVGTMTFNRAIDGAFAIALKASNSFSLYYYNGAGAPIASLAYSTIGTAVTVTGGKKGKPLVITPKDLSHASLYLVPSAASVPEPEGYAMVLAGLGAMAYLARRRSATG